MKEFNQNKYIHEYNKEHYKHFNVRLKKDEYEKLEELLKEKNLSKPDFLRKAIGDLKRMQETCSIEESARNNTEFDI